MSDKLPMPSMLEAQEEAMKIPGTQLVILQPKYDGCQAILVPEANGYVGRTRSGQHISRLDAFCSTIPTTLNKVLFCEYEPSPWSESGKSQLAGNLYNTKALEFGTLLTCFDQIDPVAFFAGEMKRQACKPRLEVLDSLKPTLTGLGIAIAPWQELPYEEAKALCKSARVETEHGTRCQILGVLAEGGIIRAGLRMEKDKARIELDVAVLHAITSEKGQIGWACVNTKKPEDGPMVVFGGVTAAVHTAMVGRVIEASALSVSSTKGAGNPTFLRDRGNEKEFPVTAYLTEHKEAVDQFLKDYRLRVVPPTPDISL